MPFQKTATIIEGGCLINESRAAFGSASLPELCRRLLDDASLVPLPTDWREMTSDKIQCVTDSLFAYTLRTPEMFRGWHSMYPTPSTNPHLLTTRARAGVDDTTLLDGEFLCLVSLGNGLKMPAESGPADAGSTFIKTRITGPKGQFADPLQDSALYMSNRSCGRTLIVADL